MLHEQRSGHIGDRSRGKMWILEVKNQLRNLQLSSLELISIIWITCTKTCCNKVGLYGRSKNTLLFWSQRSTHFIRRIGSGLFLRCSFLNIVCWKLGPFAMPFQSQWISTLRFSSLIATSLPPPPPPPFNSIFLLELCCCCQLLVDIS